MGDGDSAPDGVWDEDLAAQLLGKLVLIGVTYLDQTGATVEKQMYGRVSSAHRKRGIALALEGTQAGHTYHLPPDTRSFRVASPGEYRLRSTGEIVVNPDFTTTWVVQSPTH